MLVTRFLFSAEQQTSQKHIEMGFSATVNAIRLGARGGGLQEGGELLPETVAWRESLAIDVGDAKISHYDAFFRALKNNGMWDIADKIGLFCVGGLADARKNIKNPTATDETETGIFMQINTPTFTQYKGIERMASSNRVRTAAPSGSGNYTLTNAGSIVGCETNASSVTPEISMAFSNNVFLLGQISLNYVRSRVNSATLSGLVAIDKVFASIRSGTTVTVFSGENQTSAMNNTTALPGEIELLGYRGGANLNNSRISFVWLGGAFTQSQYLAVRSALLTLGGALGWE